MSMAKLMPVYRACFVFVQLFGLDDGVINRKLVATNLILLIYCLSSKALK